MLYSLKYNHFLILFFIFNFLLQLFFFFPGFISQIQIDQLEQALHGGWSDWQSTGFTAFVALLYKIKKHPGIVFFVSLSCLWVSLYRFSKKSEHKLAPFSFAMVAWLPWVIEYSMQLGKDSFVAHVFLLGLSFIDNQKCRYSKWFILLWSVFISILRYNSLLLVLPTIFILNTKRRSAVAISLLVVGIVVGWNIYVPAEKTYPLQYVLLHDLTAIECATNQKIIPDSFVRNPTKQHCERYDPTNGDALFFQSNSPLIHTRVRSGLNNLGMIWFSAILRHPAIYLEHRSKGFIELLSHPHEQWRTWGIVENNWSWHLLFPQISDFFANYWRINENSFFISFWPPIVLLILIAALLRYKGRAKNDILSSALFGSILYIIGFFFLGVVTDGRYLYPVVLMTPVLIINVLFKPRHKYKPAEF